MNPKEKAVILLVDDTEDDFLLFREAYLKTGRLNPLFVVPTAEAAIEYLEGTGAYANRSEYPLPGLILLDLNLPRISGFEFLAWLRQNPSFGSLRVVVLTTSEHPSDIEKAQRAGANAFVTKSSDFKAFQKAVATICSFWLCFDNSPTVKRPVQNKGAF